MGKRKAAAPIQGPKKKRWKNNDTKKVPENKDDEQDTGIVTVKIALSTVIRERFRDRVIKWIADKSIESTKICQLASLLFVQKVSAAFDHGFNTGDYSFFDDYNGDSIIEDCFFAVLQKYKESETMEASFRETVETLDGDNRFCWPKNKYYGNIFKYLIKTYSNNVTTNLTTHHGKRLFAYLKMRAWQFNIVSDGTIEFDEYDIKNAVNFAIRQYDSTQGNNYKLFKCRMLLSFVRGIGGPPDDDIARDTENDWFASLPMWLQMQREIDDFHIWAEINTIEIPKIKNLKVIPIASHLRKYIQIDADALYRIMAELKILPKIEGIPADKMCGHVCSHKEHYFNEIFDLPKIERIVKGKKKFRCHIYSDGVGASVLYNVDKNEVKKLVDDGILKKRYLDGEFIYELGIDPGMKTWNATVRRHIPTKKEVCIQFLLRFLSKFQFHNKFHCLA